MLLDVDSEGLAIAIDMRDRQVLMPCFVLVNVDDAILGGPEHEGEMYD